MTNSLFLTARRGPAITFAVLSTVILIFLPIVSGVYLSVGKSNPAPKIANALLAKSEFRDAAANKLIENILMSNIEIKQILIEIHERFFDNGISLTKNLLNILDKNGYKLFGVSPSMEELSFVKIN